MSESGGKALAIQRKVNSGEKILAHEESNRDVRSKVALALERWDLPAEFIEDLLSYQRPVGYKKGSILFASGSPSDIFFLVVEGVVRLYASRPDGGQITFMLAAPGDFLGFANSHYRGRRVHSLDASALTECSLLLFTRRRLVQLLGKQTTPALRKLIVAMNVEWTRALEWWVNFFRASLSRRFERVLPWLAAKFGQETNDGIVIDLRLSLGDLAELIGCSRPVVRKLFTQMISAGSIELTQAGKILLHERFRSPEPDARDMLSLHLKT
jgi:CRP/FNR family transcriptional regulator, cyclic AMP receptor protein